MQTSSTVSDLLPELITLFLPHEYQLDAVDGTQPSSIVLVQGQSESIFVVVCCGAECKVQSAPCILVLSGKVCCCCIMLFDTAILYKPYEGQRSITMFKVGSSMF